MSSDTIPQISPTVLTCIFAHPDDEAFGPGGTIAHYAKSIPVHIICVTDGNADGNGTLAETRRRELTESARILGAASVEFLGYGDGTLNNIQYHSMAEDIRILLEKQRPDTLLTFDMNGVSGHLDHVAVAMVASYLYEKLGFIKYLLYFCEGEYFKEAMGTDYFVYVPPGKSEKDIDMTLDVGDVLDIKLAAMKKHVSQKKDCDWIIEKQADHISTELFQVMRRQE